MRIRERLKLMKIIKIREPEQSLFNRSNYPFPEQSSPFTDYFTVNNPVPKKAREGIIAMGDIASHFANKT